MLFEAEIRRVAKQVESLIDDRSILRLEGPDENWKSLRLIISPRHADHPTILVWEDAESLLFFVDGSYGPRLEPSGDLVDRAVEEIVKLVGEMPATSTNPRGD